LSFKLVDEDKSWIPKPITCISYASPITGTHGYRNAFEVSSVIEDFFQFIPSNTLFTIHPCLQQLEKDGLLRHLHIHSDNDFVPALLSFSFDVIPRLLKHVGLNMRLQDSSDSEFRHSSMSSFYSALQNSIVKNLFTLIHMHRLPSHRNHIDKHIEKLNKITVEDLYEDQLVILSGFLSSRDEL